MNDVPFAVRTRRLIRTRPEEKTHENNREPHGGWSGRGTKRGSGRVASAGAAGDSALAGGLQLRPATGPGGGREQGGGMGAMPTSLPAGRRQHPLLPAPSASVARRAGLHRRWGGRGALLEAAVATFLCLILV